MYIIGGIIMKKFNIKSVCKDIRRHVKLNTSETILTGAAIANASIRIFMHIRNNDYEGLADYVKQNPEDAYWVLVALAGVGVNIMDWNIDHSEIETGIFTDDLETLKKMMNDYAENHKED